MIWTHTVIGGSWPERIGLSCAVVTNTNPDGTKKRGYPFEHRNKTDVLVLIQNDPHHQPGRAWFDYFSCVLDHHDIEPKPWGATT